MACYHPIGAWQGPPGVPLFFGVTGYPGWRHIEVACGRCIGCRLAKSREWALRCMHEATGHVENSFLTLTYDEEHVPPYPHSVSKRALQLFMKRFRKRTALSVRYYACGEYGGKTSRPHYHMLMFGYWPGDARPWRKSKKGHQVWTSDFLTEVWGLGRVDVGLVTMDSAGYVSRYVTEALLGRGSDVREILDVFTGEVLRRSNEFALMSRGLGRDWLNRNAERVMAHGVVTRGGVDYSIPRYYLERIRRVSPLAAAELGASRQEVVTKRRNELLDAHGVWADIDRFQVHEDVALARLNFYRSCDDDV